MTNKAAASYICTNNVEKQSLSFVCLDFKPYITDKNMSSVQERIFHQNTKLEHTHLYLFRIISLQKKQNKF